MPLLTYSTPLATSGGVFRLLSNVIFFGETRPECSGHVNAGWYASNNSQGLAGTLVPINYDSCDNNSTLGCRRPCNWVTELAFKSRHTGGALM